MHFQEHLLCDVSSRSFHASRYWPWPRPRLAKAIFPPLLVVPSLDASEANGLILSDFPSDDGYGTTLLCYHADLEPRL